MPSARGNLVVLGSLLLAARTSAEPVRVSDEQQLVAALDGKSSEIVFQSSFSITQDIKLDANSFTSLLVRAPALQHKHIKHKGKTVWPRWSRVILRRFTPSFTQPVIKLIRPVQSSVSPSLAALCVLLSL